MAERHEKAPPQRFRCRPIHVMTTSVSGALQKGCSSTTDRGKKLERKSSNQNKAGQVKGKKISPIAEGVAHQYVEGPSRGKAPALMSACKTADDNKNSDQRNGPHP